MASDSDILDPALESLMADTNHRGDIRCAACGCPISSSDNRIEVSGQHEHHCVNPLGYQFHIGCFKDAFGCDISGNPVAADSWFPRFRWQYANCSRCNRHLGWYFQDAGDGYFYGLIFDHIDTNSE